MHLEMKESEYPWKNFCYCSKGEEDLYFIIACQNKLEFLILKIQIEFKILGFKNMSKNTL